MTAHWWLVAAFQAIDRAIINPWFMAGFFGAPALTGLAAVLHLGTDDGSVLPWIVAAFVLYLIAVVVILAVNVQVAGTRRAATTGPGGPLSSPPGPDHR